MDQRLTLQLKSTAYFDSDTSAMADYQAEEIVKVHSKVHDTEAQDSDNESTAYVINALINEDHEHEIKLRTMTWQRAAWLLAGDQVCLAIMAQSWSLS